MSGAALCPRRWVSGPKVATYRGEEGRAPTESVPQTSQRADRTVHEEEDEQCSEKEESHTEESDLMVAFEREIDALASIDEFEESLDVQDMGREICESF